MKDMYFDVRIFIERIFEVLEEFDMAEDALLSLDLWALAWHGKKKDDMERFGLSCPSNWCSNTKPKELSEEEIEEWKVIFNEA